MMSPSLKLTAVGARVRVKKRNVVYVVPLHNEALFIKVATGLSF